MTPSEVKEQYLRNFLSRQRDISKQALIATATMAQANMEMILTSGLPKVWPKILGEVQEDVNIQGQLAELKKDVKVNAEAIANITEEVKLAQSSMRDMSGQA
jgi:hypothetical protein